VIEKHTITITIAVELFLQVGYDFASSRHLITPSSKYDDTMLRTCFANGILRFIAPGAHVLPKLPQTLEFDTFDMLRMRHCFHFATLAASIIQTLAVSLSNNMTYLNSSQVASSLLHPGNTLILEEVVQRFFGPSLLDENFLSTKKALVKIDEEVWL